MTWCTLYIWEAVDNNSDVVRTFSIGGWYHHQSFAISLTSQSRMMCSRLSICFTWCTYVNLHSWSKDMTSPGAKGKAWVCIYICFTLQIINSVTILLVTQYPHLCLLKLCIFITWTQCFYLRRFEFNWRAALAIVSTFSWNCPEICFGVGVHSYLIYNKFCAMPKGCKYNQNYTCSLPALHRTYCRMSLLK